MIQTVLWSLFDMGACTTQEFNKLGFDISTRSMRVDEEFVTYVGSETTCDRWKSFSIELSDDRLETASTLNLHRWLDCQG